MSSTVLPRNNARRGEYIATEDTGDGHSVMFLYDARHGDWTVLGVVRASDGTVWCEAGDAVAQWQDLIGASGSESDEDASDDDDVYTWDAVSVERHVTTSTGKFVTRVLGKPVDFKHCAALKNTVDAEEHVVDSVTRVYVRLAPRTVLVVDGWFDCNNDARKIVLRDTEHGMVDSSAGFTVSFNTHGTLGLASARWYEVNGHCLARAYVYDGTRDCRTEFVPSFATDGVLWTSQLWRRVHYGGADVTTHAWVTNAKRLMAQLYDTLYHVVDATRDAPLEEVVAQVRAACLRVDVAPLLERAAALVRCTRITDAALEPLFPALHLTERARDATNAALSRGGAVAPVIISRCTLAGAESATITTPHGEAFLSYQVPLVALARRLAAAWWPERPVYELDHTTDAVLPSDDERADAMLQPPRDGSFVYIEHDGARVPHN